MRQDREDTRLALFASVAIEELESIRKRFGPDKWDNDRRVSPAKRSAITCAMVSEAEGRGESKRVIQRDEQSGGKNYAEDLVRSTSRFV